MVVMVAANEGEDKVASVGLCAAVVGMTLFYGVLKKFLFCYH